MPFASPTYASPTPQIRDAPGKARETQQCRTATLPGNPHRYAKSLRLETRSNWRERDVRSNITGTGRRVEVSSPSLDSLSLRRKAGGRLATSTGSTSRSAAAMSVLTAASFCVMAGAAAVAAALLARKFGRGAETDGFFAAYAVYVLLVLAATACRIVVLPALARAAQAECLSAEVAGYAIALTVPATLLILAATFLSQQAAHLLTSSLPAVAEDTAASTLLWLVPAAVAQVFAGLAASSLAALDDYVTAAVAYAAGSCVALACFIWLADSHGVVALAEGVASGSFVSLAILVAALLRRRVLRPLTTFQPRVASRLLEFTQGASIPLALQGFYVIAVRFAGGLGVGRVTSFSYAYLIGSAFVGLAASPLSLVSTVPLTRLAAGSRRAAAHVTSTFCLAVTFVAGAVGVFAISGSRVTHWVLGPAYRGEVGAELGRIVIYLSPWMVASISVAVTLPLLFVAGKRRWLPALAVAALLIDVPIECIGSSRFGLGGVVAGLVVTTALVLSALLAAVSFETLVDVYAGLGAPALLSASLAALSFLVTARLLAPTPAAVVGLLLYGALIAALRPRRLRAAWSYMRALQ
jgi:hypothetical protein